MLRQSTALPLLLGYGGQQITLLLLSGRRMLRNTADSWWHTPTGWDAATLSNACPRVALQVQVALIQKIITPTFTLNPTCAQIHLNFQRKSVVGLSFDFLALNWLGFICYSIFNVAMLVSPSVRAAYRQQMGSSPGVRLNDAIFAVHAALMTSAHCT